MNEVSPHEFGFELRVCAWAEREWEPGDDSPCIVARQLGTQYRRWDTVIVECDPDGFSSRQDLGKRALDSDLLDVVPHAPDNWEWYRDALPNPGYPWRYVRETIHRADDRNLIETRRIIAVENKPDLDASAARALANQVERDVALGIADEVWVATRSTDAAVEPVLLEDLPVEAGVIVFDSAMDPSVIWHPRSLPVSESGTRITSRGEGVTCFEYVGADWKRKKRVEIAERAFSKGWRSYI
ncbi:MAG: DUF5787 family protein, partial [Halobacteriaceae archaeon]